MSVIVTAGSAGDGGFPASRGRGISKSVAAETREFESEENGWVEGVVAEKGDPDRRLNVRVKVRRHGRDVRLSREQWKSFEPSFAKDD